VNRFTLEKILSSAPPDHRLPAQTIGVALSEEDQLEPEQRTSAIVVHHPQAKYFSV
jgi:cobalamin-dependent methionine synthase I